MGVAEQCLVDMAAGLSYRGKIPFANTFAFLVATRALEMVRWSLCYGGVNVKLMAAYAGLSDSCDGPTHHAVTDLAIMRSLPNMTGVVAADPVATHRLLPPVASWDGPVYFRLIRNDVPVVFDESSAPVIGRALTLREGQGVTLVCCGLMVSRALEAATWLDRRGILTRVLEGHTVKPIDRAAIVRAASDTRALVTVEEHTVVGGLGSAVAELISEKLPVPLRWVGLRDRFAGSGPYEALLEKDGLSVASIVKAAESAIAAMRG